MRTEWTESNHVTVILNILATILLVLHYVKALTSRRTAYGFLRVLFNDLSNC